MPPSKPFGFLMLATLALPFVPTPHGDIHWKSVHEFVRSTGELRRLYVQVTGNNIRTAGVPYPSALKNRNGKYGFTAHKKELMPRRREQSGYSFPFTACWAFFARSFAVYPVTCWR